LIERSDQRLETGAQGHGDSLSLAAARAIVLARARSPLPRRPPPAAASLDETGATRDGPRAELEGALMEAIVLIVLFIAAIAALNLYEFGRID
jgi:hypothetical protein